MLSGGSSPSTSVTFAPEIDTVHVSLKAKFVVGSIVYVVGPPVRLPTWVSLDEQLMMYQLPTKFTGSLKVMTTFASRATPVAPAMGPVELTDGAASPTTLLCGFGVAAVKSAALLSVSVWPLLRRIAANVALNVGAAPAPSKKFAFPYPTRSTMRASAAG